MANASNDEVYYELGRFVELLSKSNPTVLELLASPADCIVYQDPIMEQFKMQDFITREAALFVNHQAYSSYCKAYNGYFSWVSARNAPENIKDLHVHNFKKSTDL